jgi:RNA polymerase sigma-70 factor, ECF subfamily
MMSLVANKNISVPKSEESMTPEKMESMSRAEADLIMVKRVQNGDKRSFDILVTKYQHKVYSIVSRYIRNNAQALDVTQEAFIKAYRALPGFRGDSAFYTWLYRIAINTAKNELTSMSRRPPGVDIDASEAEQFSNASGLRDNSAPDLLLQRDELKKVIFDAIDELPEDLKMALTLRELEGMSYEEIAETMDCPVGTVRSRIFRAREAVDNKIRPLIER